MAIFCETVVGRGIKITQICVTSLITALLRVSVDYLGSRTDKKRTYRFSSKMGQMMVFVIGFRKQWVWYMLTSYPALLQ